MEPILYRDGGFFSLTPGMCQVYANRHLPAKAGLGHDDRRKRGISPDRLGGAALASGGVRIPPGTTGFARWHKPHFEPATRGIRSLA